MGHSLSLLPGALARRRKYHKLGQPQESSKDIVIERWGDETMYFAQDEDTRESSETERSLFQDSEEWANSFQRDIPPFGNETSSGKHNKVGEDEESLKGILSGPYHDQMVPSSEATSIEKGNDGAVHLRYAISRQRKSAADNDWTSVRNLFRKQQPHGYEKTSTPLSSIRLAGVGAFFRKPKHTGNIRKILPDETAAIDEVPKSQPGSHRVASKSLVEAKNQHAKKVQAFDIRNFIRSRNKKASEQRGRNGVRDELSEASSISGSEVISVSKMLQGLRSHLVSCLFGYS